MRPTSTGREDDGSSFWQEVPRGARRGAIAVPSGLLAVVAAGEPEGPSVVLVPGITGSKEDFSLMIGPLTDAGANVISFDLAGQYQSFAAGPENLTPPRARYDWDLFVADLLAVLESRRRPSHVVGYSFAGVVAQLALMSRPELFLSLTLLSCPPEPGHGFAGIPVIGPLSERSSGRLDASIMTWGIAHNLNRVPAERLRFVRRRFLFTRRDSISDALELMNRIPDCRTALAATGIPKIVAVGEHDLWPEELHRRFAESIGARFLLYPGGHSPCETSPVELSRDLIAALLPPCPSRDRSGVATVSDEGSARPEGLEPGARR